MENFATAITKTLLLLFSPKIVRFRNGSNKVAIKLRVVQFGSEIILVISNRTQATLSFDFEITSMISDQIALHSVQPLLIIKIIISSIIIGFKKLLFSTNYLAKVLDSFFTGQFVIVQLSISQSHSKLCFYRLIADRRCAGLKIFTSPLQVF